MNYSLQSKRFIVLNHFLTLPNSRSLESPNRSPSKISLLYRLGELASWYQLHTSLLCGSTLHIRQKFQWTSDQLTSAYLDLQYFHRRSSKFPAEHLSLLLEWFTPNSFRTVFWVSSFYLSVNIVSYQFTVTCTENWSMRSLGQWIIENKVYLLSMLGQRKKVHDCDYVFGSSTKFQRRMNGFVKADIRSSSIKVFVHMHFAGLYLPVNPSATTVYTRSAFYPSQRFTLSL